MKKDLKYYALLALVLLLFVLTESVKKEPLNWDETYSMDDKVPFGTNAALQIVRDVFLGVPVRIASASIVETLWPGLQPFPASTAGVSNYVFVNSSFVHRGSGVDMSFDDVEAETLLEYVESGNNVLIAGERFEGLLADTLNLETARSFGGFFERSVQALASDTVWLQLSNPDPASTDSSAFPARLAEWYFSSADTARTSVLGFLRDDGKLRANFIRVNWGEGSFLIHSVPSAFTNYGVVSARTDRYVPAVLSYLPVAPTLWDEYYKLTRGRGLRTPLRYILQTEPLRWAYAVTMVALLLFIAFRCRRRQRVIPVIPPVTNASLEFVKTVGRLYYEKGNHKDIASKRASYLMDYIRTQLNLDTREVDDVFVSKVSQRSGVADDTVRTLLMTLDSVKSQKSISQRELLELNNRIESFYAASSR